MTNRIYTTDQATYEILMSDGNCQIGTMNRVKENEVIGLTELGIAARLLAMWDDVTETAGQTMGDETEVGLIRHRYYRKGGSKKHLESETIRVFTLGEVKYVLPAA